jgi:hypothetical protein
MPRPWRLETVKAEHMSKLSQRARRVALFVEGDTERGEARRRTLSAFFHRWLDPQLPSASKVGITPVKFQGVSNYLDDLPQKVALYLDDGRANFVFGLIDLYGIPVSNCPKTGCNPRKIQDLRAFSDSYLVGSIFRSTARFKRRSRLAGPVFAPWFHKHTGSDFVNTSPSTRSKPGCWHTRSSGPLRFALRLRSDLQSR